MTPSPRGPRLAHPSPREDSMVIDYRCYTFRPGTVPTFLQLAESEGVPIQKQILGNFIGMFRTEIGNVNQVIHMWGYDNVLERERRRALVAANPTFQTYVKKAREMIVEQDVRLLVPAPFSPDLSKL
ncbi:MAG: NIPSNAP family protein [Alphaproteobacteria bacterium]|nr:NIPSNAP family protein [Alphaproteobacteria bacterium]